MSQITDLKTLTRNQLSTYMNEELKLARYRADQVFQWMYQKGVSSFSEMTNLSKALRSQLEDIAAIRTIKQVQLQVAKDKTAKFLFQLHDEHKVEAVLIPEFFDDGVADRLTVCVSSQVGCVFGCSFCATGKMGLHRNLEIGEIVDQLVHINLYAEKTYGKRITNVVYMGMGEPFHNYRNVIESAHIITNPLSIGLSPRRITLSTVGLTKMITTFGDEKQPFNLAISLHAPNDEKRNKIMPINESLNLKLLKQALQHYYSLTENPVTYEYLLFNEFNDSDKDALELAEISRWIPSKLNIIMYNSVIGVTLERAKENRLNMFLKTLTKAGARATVRRSRGDDIDAGCGQLAIREVEKKGKTMAKSRE